MKNLLIFTSSHLHILICSHLLIFTSSHPHILTSSHPHIFSSSHLLIFTFSHLHIFSSSKNHHICSSSHLLIFTSSHLHIFTSSPLALLPSCSLLLFYFSSEGGGRAVQTRRHETQPFRTKWGTNAKNCGQIAISRVRGCNPFARNRSSIAKSKIAISRIRSLTLSHEMRFERQKL